MVSTPTDMTPDALRLVKMVSPEEAAKLLWKRLSVARTPTVIQAVFDLIDSLSLGHLAVTVFGKDQASMSLGIIIVVARACRMAGPFFDEGGRFGVKGDLLLNGLTSAVGLVLPEKIGGWPTLDGLTNAAGLVLPEEIGHLHLSGLKKTAGLILPEGLTSLSFDGLTSAVGFVWPNTISQSKGI